MDAQFIFSIFRQTPLQVSGVSIAHHQEVQPYVYSNWYLLFFLDGCLLSWMDWSSNPFRTTDSHLQRITRTNRCTRAVVPPDDGL